MAYSTEEERKAARRATYAKYNRAHRAERAAHNKAYVQRPDVKAKRRDAYLRNAANQGMLQESDHTLLETEPRSLPRDAETVSVNS